MPAIDAGLGEHRPPASESVRARRPDRIHPCRVGPRTGRHRLRRGCASAEQPRSGLHPSGQRDLARGLRRRVARDRPCHRRRRPDQPHANCSTRQTSTPRSPASTSSAVRRRGWRTRQAEWTSASWTYFAARDWDAMAEILADDISTDDRRRVVNAGVRHGRDAEIADMRATADIGVTNMTSTVIATRGERLALSRYRFSVAISDPRRSTPRCSASSRSTPTTGSRRCVAVRPRRHRRRLRGTRRPLPRRRSGRPRAHVVGHRADLRRVQPARTPATTPDWVNIDHRRGDSVRAR